MGDQTLLNTSSPEFGQVEYYLQWCLGASTAQVNTAYALSNPHLSSQFERRCKNLLVLDSWIPLSDLKPPNSLEEIVARGFALEETSNTSGIKLGVGEIKIPRDKGGKHEYQFLLCKVGVGRAQICDLKRAFQTPIADGYDSLLLNQSPEAASSRPELGKKDGKPALSTSGNGKDQIEHYHQEYVIKNSAQLLPTYLVTFSYDPEKERQSRERPQCDNCENALATVFCAADNANLCTKCDNTAHASKLTSRHIRTPIGQGADVFGFCRHHKDKLVEFFCPECHVPVCVHCKMVGNHSSGDAARHQLVSVAESYQTVLAESMRADPVIQQRQARIASQVQAVNERAKAVENMALQIETQLEELYRRAQGQLRFMIKRKLDILLGDERELQRQRMEIQHHLDFAKYQQTGDATTFLFSYARQQRLREQLHSFAHFRDAIDVPLDVKVNGILEVVTTGAPNDNVGGVTSSRPTSVLPGSVIAKANPNRAVSPLKARSAILMQNSKRDMPCQGVNQGAHERRISDFFSETLSALDEFQVSSAAVAHSECADD